MQPAGEKFSVDSLRQPLERRDEASDRVLGVETGKMPFSQGYIQTIISDSVKNFLSKSSIGFESSNGGRSEMELQLRLSTKRLSCSSYSSKIKMETFHCFATY